MKRYIIAHDLGTSADKASLVDVNGRILCTHSVGYPVVCRQPGWSEQDPLNWWNAFCNCNRALTVGIDPQEVAGVSLSGQMMCCLPIGEDGSALCPAMIWADHRADVQAKRLEDALGADAYYRITGMRGSANYTLPKMMWLKEHRPELYQKTISFLAPKDYINFRMTGRMATDPETAAYMHCLDRRSKTWSTELLSKAGIDLEKLPELLPSGTVIGENREESCGLALGTPVVMGIGDGGAATLGTGVIDPGEAYTILGTSSWVCAVTGSQAVDSRRSISKLNYLDSTRDSGTMQAGGFSYNWLRNMLWEPGQAGGQDYALIDRLAAQSSPGAGGVLFLPYLFGERSPWWDSKLRASFLGMTAQTTRADLCRSVLEGVSIHLSLILNRILEVNRLSGIKSMKLAGGGAKSPLWRQIFADVYGMPITTVEYPNEAGTLGVAVLAGVSLGMYPDITVIQEFQRVTGITEPDSANVMFYRRLSELFREAVEQLSGINHALTDLNERRDV